MYKYETHLHTRLASACANFEPRDVVEKFVRLGYRGVFVTDHFLNGNTSVPKNLPWSERVARFCDSYRAVKAAAHTRLDVFFGFEYSYKGTDFLVYGLGEQWLLSHPEVMEMSVNEFCDFARGEGALVVQAHPYREAFYIDHIRLFPAVVDGIEVINANRDERCNSLGNLLADAYQLVKTAGSDIHTAAQENLAGMEFEKKICSEADFVARVKAGEGTLFTLTDKGAV